MTKKDEIQEIPAASIIFDGEFYVRYSVDRENINRLAHALETGAHLPPIAVQKSTSRIIYGVHRWHAYTKVYGVEAKIPALVLDVDDAEAVRLALAENAQHGMPFRPIDLKRATIVAERFHLTDEEIVRCLHIPPGRLMDLRAQRGIIRRFASVNNGNEFLPLKGSMAWLSGQELTQKQIDVSPGAPGAHPTLMARQLTALIDAGAIDRTNDRLRRALLILRSALECLDLDTPWGEGDAGDETRGVAVSA